MTVGSLFSGIGGFDLGLERAGMKVLWQVENNDHARKVLRKHWPNVPCHYDITTIDWRDIPRVDLVCGGFPCQPFSLAGKRRGQSDDRYLWPEVVRCLGALRPAWFVGENVPGIINLALDQVCADLESLGYQVWPVCIPACAVDAPQVRDRLWIIANSSIEPTRETVTSHSSKKAISGRQDKAPSAGRRALLFRAKRWSTEPSLCRVDDGVSYTLDRLEGLGNAVVPAIVEAIGRMILECEKHEAQS